MRGVRPPQPKYEKERYLRTESLNSRLLGSRSRWPSRQRMTTESLQSSVTPTSWPLLLLRRPPGLAPHLHLPSLGKGPLERTQIGVVRRACSPWRRRSRLTVRAFGGPSPDPQPAVGSVAQPPPPCPCPRPPHCAGALETLSLLSIPPNLISLQLGTCAWTDGQHEGPCRSCFSNSLVSSVSSPRQFLSIIPLILLPGLQRVTPM